MRVLSDVISRILQVAPTGPLRDEFLALEQELIKSNLPIEAESPFWQKGSAIISNHIPKDGQDDTQASIVSIWMGTPASAHPLSHID